MRGQRLFFRPLEPGDAESLARFFSANDCVRPTPACGLLGKLVGEIAVVAELEIATDEVAIRDLVVSRELRRKRIGRLMAAEIAQFARKLGCSRVIVREARDAGEFLRRTGFALEDGVWVRRSG